MNGNKNITANFAPGDPNLGTLTVTIQPPNSSGRCNLGIETDFSAPEIKHHDIPNEHAHLCSYSQRLVGAGVYPVSIIAGQTTNLVVAVSSTTGSTVGTDQELIQQWRDWQETLAAQTAQTLHVSAVRGTSRLTPEANVGLRQ